MPSYSSSDFTGRHYLFCVFLVFIIALADQYSKWLVMEYVLRVEKTMPFFLEWFFHLDRLSMFEMERPAFHRLEITSWFNLVMVWNQGISFGLMDTLDPRMSFVFIGISMTISLGLLVWMALVRDYKAALAIAAIIGGALGNIIDRFRFAAVADFIDLHVAGFHWPAFNFADSCIVCGAFYLMAYNLFFMDQKKPEVKS